MRFILKKQKIVLFFMILSINLCFGCSKNIKRSYEEQLVYDFELAFSKISIYKDGNLKNFDGYVDSANQLYNSLMELEYSESQILIFIDSIYSYMYTENKEVVNVLGRDLLGEIELLDSKRIGYEGLKEKFENIKGSNPLASATDSKKIVVCKNRVFSDEYIEVKVLRYSIYDIDKEIIRAISYVFDSGNLKISFAGVKYKDIDSIDKIPKEYLEEGWTITI